MDAFETLIVGVWKASTDGCKLAEKGKTMDNHPSLATLVMAALFWVVVFWMVGYVIRSIWRKFRWDIFYAGGAISILTWVCWATFEVNNLLYHTVLWFLWPGVTTMALFATDWLAKRAEKH